MKVFEFHFNPHSKKEDAIFDTFCFSPENRKEKQLGNLYLAGFLRNSLPQNFSLLATMAETIKTILYQSPSESVEENFKMSLQASNRILRTEIKKENTSWLGNLNMVVFSLDQNLCLRFSHLGSLKSFLFKNEDVLDIGKSVESRVDFSREGAFQNMLTAQLNPSDKILVFNPEIFDALQKEKVLQELISADKKGIKKIFQTKRKELRELFGFCFLILLTKEGLFEKTIKSLFWLLRLPKLPKKKPLSPAPAKQKQVRLKRFSSVLKKPCSVLVSRAGKQKLKTGLVSLLVLALLLLLGYLIF